MLTSLTLHGVELDLFFQAHGLQAQGLQRWASDPPLIRDVSLRPTFKDELF
jgi:hypothetical protein